MLKSFLCLSRPVALSLRLSLPKEKEALGALGSALSVSCLEKLLAMSQEENPYAYLV